MSTESRPPRIDPSQENAFLLGRAAGSDPTKFAGDCPPYPFRHQRMEWLDGFSEGRIELRRRESAHR